MLPRLVARCFSKPFARCTHESVPGRTGALAVKAGMLSEFDSWGVRQELTVLLIDECYVTQVKTVGTNGYTSLQLGISDAKKKNVTKPLLAHFEKAGVHPKRKLSEFRVMPTAVLPLGTKILASHFVPGQLVDIRGVSKGKGFAGAMKKWNFAGQRASHGVSKTHRAIGSTGGGMQEPGHVFKGKKMPGRMGSENVCVQNLKVYKIDTARNLLYIKGHVPGNAGGFVKIVDAVKGPNFPQKPPFPTFLGEVKGEVIYAPANTEDPLKPGEVDA